MNMHNSIFEVSLHSALTLSIAIAIAIQLDLSPHLSYRISWSLMLFAYFCTACSLEMEAQTKLLHHNLNVDHITWKTGNPMRTGQQNQRQPAKILTKMQQT